MSERKSSRFFTVLKSTRTRALLSLGIVLGLTSVSTLAFWTDEAQLNTGTIQSGTLNLLIDGVDNVPTSTKLAITNMVPGESVATTIRVDRAGNSIPFTYSATAVTTNTNGLATALRFRVFTGATAGNVIPNANGIRTQICDGGSLEWGGADGLAWTSAATVIANRASTLSTTPIQAGVVSENLCVQAILPAATGNGAQTLSTAATLTFTATQLS